MNSSRWAISGRFLAGSAASFLLVMGITMTLHEGLNLSAATAYAFALTAALGFNFFFNRHVVFQSTATNGGAQALRFVVTSCLFRLTEWATFGILAASVTVPYTVLATAVQLISLVLKYAVFRRFVFR
jgi:putative flippase GtrA